MHSLFALYSMSVCDVNVHTYSIVMDQPSFPAEGVVRGHQYTYVVVLCCDHI